MIDLFIIKLIISFFVGSIWITLLTIFSEKFGTKLGGAIAGIPATMVVSLFFIGYTRTIGVAVQSTTLIPLILGVNALVVVSYLYLSKRLNFAASFFYSLVLWFFAAFIIVLSGLNNFLLSIAAYIIIILFSYYALEKKLSLKSKEKVIVNYSVPQIIFRGLVSGGVIVVSVILAKVSGPLIGGVFATFPTLTMALILITYLNHGNIFLGPLLKNFIISGTINVLIFVIAIRYSYPILGLGLGTLVSLSISFISTYITYNLINKKLLS